jgi:hypothetical protein
MRESRQQLRRQSRTGKPQRNDPARDPILRFQTVPCESCFEFPLLGRKNPGRLGHLSRSARIGQPSSVTS